MRVFFHDLSKNHDRFLSPVSSSPDSRVFDFSPVFLCVKCYNKVVTEVANKIY